MTNQMNGMINLHYHHELHTLKQNLRTYKKTPRL